MEQQEKLPNGTVSIILGIFGFLCCCTGIFGTILSGIGFSLARKSESLYNTNPDNYSNYNQIKTAKIINIIALILGIIMTIRWIYIIYNAGGIAEFKTEFLEAYNEAMEQYQQ